MPGIVGLITNRPRQDAERQLLGMLNSLRHEVFYNSGTWMNEELGVYIGWVARKASFADCMPLCNEREDVVLVFAGEDYQEPELAAELKQRGHDLGDDTASYLPHLYEEDPHGFYAKLNGRFHGLLVDRTRRIATLFNDRYGMGRLYYYESSDDFYFAAEAKALLAVCPELRKASLSGLAEFVSHGCVLENRTIFERVRVLPPGSAWLFRNGSVRRKDPYFDPKEWEQQDTLTPDQYYQELKETFRRTLPRYFSGREKVGMSLTGGLDTRMIMAWQTFLPGQLPCYSFGGMLRECQDVLLARKVAARVGQPHQVITVGQDFLRQFPHYVERAVYLTDGCVEPTRSTDLYVNERAARIAPVRMTGNYGGEVLRRVRTFKPVPPATGLFVSDFSDDIDKAQAVYTRQLSGHPLSFAVFKMAPWHHYGLQALEQTQLALRSPYLDNDFVKTVFRAPASATLSNETSLRLIEDGNPVLRRIRTDFGVAESGIVPPSLVRRYMTFTFKAEYAYDYGMPQWIARVDHLLRPLRLERMWLGRHKFYHFRVWYRDALSKYVQEMLLDPLTLSRPYLDRRTVEAVVRSHVKGSRNYTTAIHKLLSLELIHRLFIDRQLDLPAAARTLKISNTFADQPLMSRS